MTRLLLAALALAFVCSPAMAAVDPGFDASRMFVHAFLAIILGGMLLGAAFALARYISGGFVVAMLATLVILGVGMHPALADEVVRPHVDLPWGDWITAILQPASAILVPLAAAAVTAGVAKISPWASLVLSRTRIQSAVQAGADYGISAVAGAVKGKTLSVPVGLAVIAEGVQHVVNTTPKKVLDKAGGAEGVAKMIFRALPLDEHADIKSVLQPALDDLKARGLIAK